MFLAEMPDVVISRSSNRALRLVSGVIIHLCKEFVVKALRLASDQRQDRSPLQPFRLLDIEHLADSRIEVHLGNHGVTDLAAPEPSRSPHHEVNRGSMYRQVALHARKSDPVI